jgi:predicted acyltransferase
LLNLGYIDHFLKKFNNLGAPFIPNLAQMTLSATLKDAPKRLLSVDAFRALVMLCMIFINDLSGVKGMPFWMDHAGRTEDRMGFADTIFPAFLFIVGLSIPLAINRKLQKGASFGSIAFSIVSRSFALIVMGFMHVNLESYDSAAAVLPESVWEILITLSFFLIWLDYPSAMHMVKKYFLIGAGWLILLLMAFLFVGGERHGSGTHGLRPEWWGILGIIGWSYLICAFVYLLTKGKFAAIIIAFIVFMGFNIIDHGMHLHESYLAIYDGSSLSLCAAGMVISLCYARLSAKGYNTKLWFTLFLAGCVAIVLGFVLRPYTEGISKIRATPPWVLICTGISILMFEIMIYLVDFKGKKNWFSLIWPAGTATLTCYLIPYFQVGFYNLFHFHYPAFLNEGIGGFFRSWAVAFVVVIIGGFLAKRGLKLKV